MCPFIRLSSGMSRNHSPICSHVCVSIISFICNCMFLPFVLLVLLSRPAVYHRLGMQSGLLCIAFCHDSIEAGWRRYTVRLNFSVCFSSLPSSSFSSECVWVFVCDSACEYVCLRERERAGERQGWGEGGFGHILKQLSSKFVPVLFYYYYYCILLDVFQKHAHFIIQRIFMCQKFNFAAQPSNSEMY